MSDRSSFARTRNGKDVRVAHRRTPSEMTPLVRDNLAMQHQMYTGAQYGAPPGAHPVPGQYPNYVVGYPMMAPPIPYYSTHNRTRSQGGHARRHSLQVSEAIEAARERQDGASSASPAHGPIQSGGIAGQTQMSPPINIGSPGGIAQGVSDFKFPPSPEHAPQPGPSQQTPQPQHHGHRRGDSRNFQLPAQPFQPRHQHQNSGHHRRSSSHLAVPFVPGHRTGGSFSSVSSIAAFTETQSTRKSLFVPYLTQASVPQLLADGFLVSGTLRVNRKNRNDAYVSTDLLDADVFICGSKDRNRALDGDLVAIELLDVDEVWDAKREKEEKKKRRDQADDSRLVETASGELRRRGSLRQRPPHKRNDDVEVEGQSLFLREEEPLSDERRPLYAGHVVAVLERPAGQLFSGTLGLLRPSSQATKERQDAERAEKGQPPLNDRPDRPKIVWFKPTDKCVPLMAIPTEQAPADFVENHQAYADRIFVASVKRWPITSLHPFGTIVEEIGPAGSAGGDVAIRTAILRDNNFGSHKFSDAAQADAEQAAQEMMAASGSEGSPAPTPGTALSLNGLAQHAYTFKDNKLSIHVIDVTRFIREESALDRELRHKSAGAYMDGMPSPLAPLAVLESFAFKVGRKVPALTVEFALGKPVEGVPSIEGTTIKASVVEVTKETATLPAELEQFATVGLALDELFGSGPGRLDLLATPHGLANGLRSLGAMVNSAIAQKLLSKIGDATLLRRQGEPQLAKLEALASALRARSIAFDSASSATIRASIAAIEDPHVRAAAQVALAKTMAPCKYVVAGLTDPMAYGHYWHGAPAYTHFDQPLYRYADHVVHRQVHEMLAGSAAGRSSAHTSELTFRLDCARNVRVQSEHLLQATKIAETLSSDGGWVLHTGTVVQVYESAFDVVVAKLNIEKRVHGDQLPLNKAEFDQAKHVLELHWDDADAATYQGGGKVSQLDIAKRAASEASEASPDSLDAQNRVQTVRLFDKVPVLVRTDATGRVVPSICVRTPNPFYKG